MKFKNNTGQNVYIDLGGFVLVRPNEILDLEGHPNCAPLTRIEENAPPPKKKSVKKKKPSKVVKPNTSGTI
jgi:hypothetical protein